MNASEPMIAGESLPTVARLAKASGLEGVVVADTRLSHVDGERGELLIAGVAAETLALSGEFSFESVVVRLFDAAGAALAADFEAQLAVARGQAFERLAALEGALRLPDAMASLLASVGQGCVGASVVEL